MTHQISGVVFRGNRRLGDFLAGHSLYQLRPPPTYASQITTYQIALGETIRLHISQMRYVLKCADWPNSGNSGAARAPISEKRR